MTPSPINHVDVNYGYVISHSDGSVVIIKTSYYWEHRDNTLGYVTKTEKKPLKFMSLQDFYIAIDLNLTSLSQLWEMTTEEEELLTLVLRVSK